MQLLHYYYYYQYKEAQNTQTQHTFSIAIRTYMRKGAEDKSLQSHQQEEHSNFINMPRPPHYIFRYFELCVTEIAGSSKAFKYFITCNSSLFVFVVCIYVTHFPIFPFSISIYFLKNESLLLNSRYNNKYVVLTIKTFSILVTSLQLRLFDILCTFIFAVQLSRGVLSEMDEMKEKLR